MARRQPQAERGQDQAVSRQQFRPLHLPTENGHLMAKGEDLEVALCV